MQKDTEALTASGASILEVSPTSCFSLFEKINLLYHLDYLFFFFFFFFFSFYGLSSLYGSSWAGVESELQLLANATATETPDPSWLAACGNARSLTHWARPGIEPTFSPHGLCCALNLLGHSGNSSLDYLELGFLLFEALQVLTDMLSMFKHISFPISS